MISIDLKSLVTKLNPTCKFALEGAAGLCLSRTHYNVEIEHWLLKLLETPESDVRVLLEKFDISPAVVLRALNSELDSIKGGNTRAPALSASIVDLIKSAWVLASVEYGVSSVTSSHLLGAFLIDESLRRTSSLPQGVLKAINPESLREFIKVQSFNSLESPAKGDESFSASDELAAPSATPSLDKFTVNLTAAALEGKIDPVLGRDDEVRQIIDILIRRRQNNPILTGEAGVGKTAVVEGFALRIAHGDVPDQLKNVVIRSLDLGLLQAGASVKGEFENRLKSVIAEVKASPIPIIMFIDEAHTLIGAGGKEGQGDAANLLKPALARGELRTIAATTWAEYKKYFERDPALTRRFQVVKIEEPSEENAISMMRSIARTLEKHHQVRILDEAIVDSVRLSSRYITARQLPDKSVSLLDTACARVALSQRSTPSLIEDTQRQITEADATIVSLSKENASSGIHDQTISDLEIKKQQLEQQLIAQQQQWDEEKNLVTEIHALISDIESQSNVDHDTRTNLRAQLQTLDSTLAKLQGDSPLISKAVDSQAIAEVVANWTGIPVGKMVSNEIQAILNLKDALETRVIGQPHALTAIAECIKTSRAGLTDPRKPIGVFFMVGSSGVGKTETALALADILYGGEQNITTINMSEFKEEHKVSMLLGSPPGYVGYGEGGVLTEAVRRKPYSVVLLDEMEKAHPGVQDVFYNLFDKGTIKDGEGRDIDFRNTVIIMTSNAAEEHIRAMCASNEERPDPDVLLDNFRPQLLRYFKPAFIGRTTVIPYYPLGDDELLKISQINMARVAKRVKSHYNATFSYDEDVLLHIVARSQEVDTGARNIENIVSRHLLPALATECLALMADGKAIQHIHVGIADDETFTYHIE